MSMKTYEWINYDVWGNPRDGYEVNDAHRTGIRVDIDDDADALYMLKVLKAADIVRKGVRLSSVVFDDTESGTIYASAARDGRPEGELRLVED